MYNQINYREVMMVTRSIKLSILTIAALIAGNWVLSSSVTANKYSTIDFNKDIRPIFSDNCYTCHGPDEKQRKAGLRLDTKEGIAAKQGIIIPGKSSESRLIKRITSKDSDLIMPPTYSGHKLTEKQIELITKWIDEGAKWNDHWAYGTVSSPAIPYSNKDDAKNLKYQGVLRNPIDNFVITGLEKRGLGLSPEADKATLIRRVYLDLTGLPPSMSEVDEFLNDKSPNAYEKIVDKLLASQHYGERMAMQWIDYARYADTHGYHIDSGRVMWPWRDWVIKAFNTNMPFDKFTVEQIAGDLLPDATTEQKLASGFNRNHMINFEGGAIPEEYLNEYVVDRVETVSSIWMATTMGCARCHNHKYDPITQKDFYKFYAFFNNVDEKGLDGKRGNAEPFLYLPTDEQKTQLKQLSESISALDKELESKEVTDMIAEWQKKNNGQFAASPVSNMTALYELDGALSDSSGNYRHGKRVYGDPTFGNGPVNSAVFLDAQTLLSFGKAIPLNPDNKFSMSFWVRPSISKAGYKLFQALDETTGKGFELSFDSTQLVDIQRWSAPLTVSIFGSKNTALKVHTQQHIESGMWTHIAFIFDSSKNHNEVKIYLNGKAVVLIPEASVDIALSLKDFASNADLIIGTKFKGRAYNGGIDDLRIYSSDLSPEDVYNLAVNYPPSVILSGIGRKPDKKQEEQLQDYFLTYLAPDEIKAKYAQLGKLKKEKQNVEKKQVSIMVMNELKENPRESFILERGDYRNKGEKVDSGIPVIFNGSFKESKDTKLTRLDLANWIVSPENPLTARVTVNRFWEMYFGSGIVKTSDNFGMQGDAPSHPELLDWMASEFIRTGWNIKAMQRLIVTSSTYRQSSKILPELLSKDPDNKWLSRGPRYRMPAEMIRDNALYVSGLLNGKIGGASVYPYQPDGLWEETSFGDGFSAQAYEQSHGQDLYRRSMYTFWKRTSPPPSFAAFDAPDREKCTIKRSMTNTPLQALVLMNDITFIEAARKLAEKTLLEKNNSASDRIKFAFRTAVSRYPTSKELNLLRDLLSQQLLVYSSDKIATDKLLKSGESAINTKLPKSELAAWTIVASAILNLDETITKF